VLSGDGRQVRGWITNQSVLQTVASRIGGSRPQDSSTVGEAAPGRAEPPALLHGYRVLEVSIGPDSLAPGRPLSTLSWPPGSIAVSVLRRRGLQEPDPDLTLAEGDRVSLLVPAGPAPPQDQADGGHSGGGPAPPPGWPAVPADH
jgi:chloride channel protein, CIC family